MARPTIHDVARSAQVSLATVDRVLNKRGGVAEKSVRKVLEAVEITGYVRDRRRPTCRVNASIGLPLSCLIARRVS